MLLDEIKQHLTNFKRRGGQFTAQCPVCMDEKHLYIKEENDKTLMYCQKCNAKYPEIMKALNITKDNATIKIAEQYDHIYKQADGTVAYGKTRTKYSNGKKQFSFFYYDSNGQKVYKKPQYCDSLYNLDLLEKASNLETLYIVEGEKCADSMIKAGFLATTANTGAGNTPVFSEDDKRLLAKFKNKVVIPDNDEVGQRYAKYFMGANVLNLADIWADIKPKQDIADYLQKHDGAELRKYIFKAIEDMDSRELLDAQTFCKIQSIADQFERKQLQNRCEIRAKALGILRQFQGAFKAFQSSLAKKTLDSARNKTEFSGQSITLNCGSWRADDFGVKKTELGQNNEPTEKEASPIPIMPVAIFKNVDTDMEKIKLEFHKNNKWHSCVCDRSTTASNSKIIELANWGVEVNSENSKLLVKYIADVVSMNTDVIPHSKSISHMGWTGSGFMPYSSDVVFDGEREYRSLHQCITSSGSLDEWCQYMKPLRENIYLRMAMSASFASPILSLIGTQPFVFHLWGTTGSGKTVALMVAMSIWGNPALGKLVKTMNMTTNSMMSTAAFFCNLPFAGDELQTIKQRGYNYDALIMRVCEGVDRGRMSYDKVQETKSWNCSFLFTGEEPCTMSNSGGGAKNRVIEIECLTDIVKNGNAVVNFINQNYGLAGPVFVEKLREIKNIAEQHSAIFKEIMQETDTTEKQAHALAVMLLADRLASEMFFTGEKPLDMATVKEFVIKKIQVETYERAYNFVINIIAKNIHRFSKSLQADSVENVKNERDIQTEGVDKFQNETWGCFREELVFINKEVLLSELSKEGFEFEAIKRGWLSNGYIELNTQGRWHHYRSIDGKPKAMYIKLKIKEKEEEERKSPI